MKRLLFLTIGPYFIPNEIPVREKYRYLSKVYSGDIIAIVHKKEFRHAVLDNFVLRGLYLPQRIRYLNVIRDIAYSVFALCFCLYMYFFKRKKYDVVVCYEPFVTGVLALIISKLTGAKFIVEVNGNYKSAFKVNSNKTGLIHRLKHKYTEVVIPFVLSRADGAKFLYQDQMKIISGKKPPRKWFIFANFVPINQFKSGKSNSDYILFLGYPWYLKGVDVLIKAFNKICKEFPEYTLKIVGYCPDKSYFKELIGDNDRIELCNPVWYEEAIKLISECSLFVLPSRTEGMGRVLLEAMASKKPIIASNVDGIPSVIKHGKNGLLFESENVDDLALKMRTLLTDQNYARQLAENGYRYVHEELSEERYVENFSKMIEQVTTNQSSRPVASLEATRPKE